MKKDIDILEKVQRRATKMVKECRGMSYSDRLRVCGLTTLERRRQRGDLIETYKLMTGQEGMPYERFFQLAPESRTRGHKFKLYKSRVGSWKSHFFSARVINQWNELDEKTVSAASMNSFKNRLGFYGY